MTIKRTKKLLIGSPLIVVQLALFTYMTYYGL